MKLFKNQAGAESYTGAPGEINAEIDAQILKHANDFSDVIALAKPDAPGFTTASSDSKRHIYMFTKPVASSPIHMMKASVRMPCPPKDFLKYLEMDARSIWDDHFLSGQVKRMIGDGIQLKHITFLSPMSPILRNRDFELVVSEKMQDDGTALLKAFSTPVGYVAGTAASGGNSGGGVASNLMSSRKKEVVRGEVLLSGFVAKPRGDKECDVTYIALVLPNGRIPPMLVNIVIGKQTRAMAHLQKFIINNPVDVLFPALEKKRLPGEPTIHQGRVVSRSGGGGGGAGSFFRSKL